MEIAFHFQSRITLTNRKSLKLFLQQIFKRQHTSAASLDIIFCDDEYLLNINRDFLRHDYYTDIITFNLASGQAAPVQGELYISTERVRDNAVINKATVKEELHRVIFHGVLHLCGLKDKTPADIKAMRAAEDRYLSLYFKQSDALVPRGT